MKLLSLCFMFPAWAVAAAVFLFVSSCHAWTSPPVSPFRTFSCTRSTSNTRLHQSSSQPQPATTSSFWFPTRIQETVDYKNVVKSAYVRHVVVETEEMARAALEMYYQNMEQHADPFGEVARSVSACPQTRADGGRIGWINPRSASDNVSSDMIPGDVLEQLWASRPKSGDMIVLGSNTTNQFHLVRVEEVSVLYKPTTSTAANQFNDQDDETIVGSYSGQNALLPRSKLKGSGVTPQMPSLSSDNQNNNNNNNNNNNTYFIHTAGCQMNMADTERLAGVLEHDLNMKPASDGKTANVVVLNTCSIRDHAEQKVYDMLGPYAARKRSNDNLALVVTGCVAQQEGQELMRRIPEIDVVLGPQYVPHLKNVLESVKWGHQVVATAPTIHQADDFSKPIRGHKIKAWVNVIMGCNEHCTYCVVPAVRGMESSRPMESILKECLELQNEGYKEVTLLGQNIDAYGRDMTPKTTFCDLLHYLNANLADGIRIRYVTSHPRYFSDRVIDAVANLDKVCECFHMPFQAGDDEVLKRMRRGYTFDSYMRIIDKIRSKAPDASICGDVIVGFPGETDEAFERTLDLMREVKFDNLNTFAYSPRPNTEAALWDDQVPEEIKSERLQRVQELAAQHGLERSQRYVGRTVEVLVEDANPRNPQNQVMGRTRQGRQVFFDGRLDELQGQLVQVLITESRTWSLMGELTNAATLLRIADLE